MQILSKLKEHSDIIVKLLPLFAFAVPLALLYGLNPADPYLNLSPQDSFQLMWKGRTFELFFIWLIALGVYSQLGNLQVKNKQTKQSKARRRCNSLVTSYGIRNFGVLFWVKRRNCKFFPAKRRCFLRFDASCN